MIFELKPIGYVRGGRTAAIDDHWGASAACIELDDEQFGDEALFDLASLSPAEVIFLFDQVPDHRIETGARHPRGNTNWPKTGIFAQRGKNRPNRLGLTSCQITGAEGTKLHVRGLDATGGSPVLDIKPVMSGFGVRGQVREPDWAKELMAGYW
jgi:tRNA (Thr-GGU) A37 N-methylase